MSDNMPEAPPPYPGRFAQPAPTSVTVGLTSDGAAVALVVESVNGTFLFALPPDFARQVAHMLREGAKECRKPNGLLVPRIDPRSLGDLKRPG